MSMMKKSSVTKHVYLGDTWFTPPFKANGYYVEDATGKEVADAKSLHIAKGLAEVLNEQVKTLQPVGALL
jgi:hypothetical protein